MTDTPRQRNAQAKRNMKVSTKESTGELWLTDQGFVLLAHDDKNEAIVCVGGCETRAARKREGGWRGFRGVRRSGVG